MRPKADQKGQLRGIVLDVDGTLLDPWHPALPRDDRDGAARAIDGLLG